MKRRRADSPSEVGIKRERPDGSEGPGQVDDAGAAASDASVAKPDGYGGRTGFRKLTGHFGTPAESTMPKVACKMRGTKIASQPLMTSELGLGEHFGGWSSRSARLLAVYVRQHYKQARPAEWRAMAQSPAGGDEDDEVASLPHSHSSPGLEQKDRGSTAAARSMPAGGPTVIDMDTDDLNDDLSCPICLGVIRKAVTTIECLHRFCTECIEKSLRLGQKECPTCRERCPSRRFLRPDPNFDALIGKPFSCIGIALPV
jgi:hypothetical protein